MNITFNCTECGFATQRCVEGAVGKKVNWRSTYCMAAKIIILRKRSKQKEKEKKKEKKREKKPIVAGMTLSVHVSEKNAKRFCSFDGPKCLKKRNTVGFENELIIYSKVKMPLASAGRSSLGTNARTTCFFIAKAVSMEVWDVFYFFFLFFLIFSFFFLFFFFPFSNFCFFFSEHCQHHRVCSGDFDRCVSSGVLFFGV
jgi:hypothetical protein